MKDRADKPSSSALAKQEPESIPAVEKGFHEEMNDVPSGGTLLEDGSFEFQSCAFSDTGTRKILRNKPIT
ncbi:hypothetical protein [Halobacillus litoralis]|uniref:hypothetical protein n=1 Tax=Halobacillus litoralis TaxID=45668 RepID=UPI00136DAF1A|nr:hypothetical protein [Halobacillus litoralis]MYL36996.1 hypothetical protein [Halobacillus litoralis]